MIRARSCSDSPPSSHLTLAVASLVLALVSPACLQPETPGYVCRAGFDDAFVCEKRGACGNGRIDPGEDCDDANLIAGDGCAATCRDQQAPLVEILFPIPGSVTRSDQLTVRGIVTDASGVAAIRVNGVVAGLVPGGGEERWRWRVALPVATGTREIIVESEDSLGNRSLRADGLAITVDSGLTMRAPQAMIVDTERSRALVSNALPPAVMAVDLENGARTVLDSTHTGTLPLLGQPGHLTLDTVRHRALVIDGMQFTVLAVDLDTGHHTLVSGRDRFLGGNLVGAGPEPGNMAAIAVDEPRDRILVLDVDGIKAVDPDTGDRSWFIEDFPAFLYTRLWALDTAHDRLLLMKYYPPDEADQVLAIDLDTGERTVLGDGSGSADIVFSRPDSMAVDQAQGRLLVADGMLDAVVAIDLDTGVRTMVSDASSGAGIPLRFPTALALDPARGRLLIAEGSLDAVVAVDPVTGARSLAISDDVGTGPALDVPAALVLDDTHGRVLALDDGDEGDDPAVIAIELDTGVRRRIDDPAGTAPALARGLLALDAANGRLLALEASLAAVVAIDPATGQRTRLPAGAGPALLEPTAMALDSARNQVLVADAGLDAVMAVDLATGARFLVGDGASGTLLDLHSPTAMALDPARDQVLVADGDLDAILAIDLATGARSMISGAGVGPTLVGATGMALDPEHDRILVTNGLSRELVAVDLATGHRTLLSDNLVSDGVTFRIPRAVALYRSGESALVLDAPDEPFFPIGRELRGQLLAVDLETGERVILAH